MNRPQASPDVQVAHATGLYGRYEPIYWEIRNGAWSEFSLGGMRALDPSVPVLHVSYFEADAFAR